MTSMRQDFMQARKLPQSRGRRRIECRQYLLIAVRAGMRELVIGAHTRTAARLVAR